MKHNKRPRALLIYLPPSGGDFFPISLGYISASCMRHSIDITLADLTTKHPPSPKQIVALAKTLQPHIVGFSACQWNIYSVLAMATLIKKVCRNTTVIMGGPQVTCMPAEALHQMQEIDILCRGEGEIVVPALSQCIANGGKLKTVPGIAFRERQRIIDTKLADLVEDLDKFPSPYQSDVFNFADHRTGAMISSRGCPFDCHFCYTPRAFAHTVRYHSAQRIIEDIEVCVKHDIRYFFFADPSFTVSKKRVLEIMRGIIKRRLKIRFWCETRADLVDRETLSIMARAGAYAIAYGLETSDRNVMKAINKEIDLEQFRQTVKITQSLGIIAEVFTLYGLPQQTYESARKTAEYVQSLDINLRANSGGQQLALYFGTRMHDTPSAFGLRVIQKKRPAFLSPAREFHTAHMGKKNLLLIEKYYRTG